MLHPRVRRSIQIAMGSATTALVVSTASAQQLLFELAGDNVITRKPDDQFGVSCVGLGDVDGDGISDLLVGAHRYNTTLTRVEGAAFVFSGATQALIRKHVGPSKDGQLGAALDGGRDVDGDGVPDYVVGEPYGDSSNTDGGSVHVYSGSSGAELLTLHGERSFDLLGTDVALVPDVDGDGMAEVVATANLWDDSALGLVQCGRGYCWSGRTGALLWTHDGVVNDQWLMWCTELGDVDGDGIHDVGFGSGGAGAAGNGAGKVEVVSGVDGTQLYSMVGGAANDVFARVRGTGDVDADGVEDFLVGALGVNNRRGRITVHSGASGQEITRHDGSQKNEQRNVGATRARIDWNGDGHADYMFGSSHFVNDDCAGGSVFLHCGRTGRLLFEYRSRDDLSIGVPFGNSVSTVSDLTHDGIPEVMIGAPGAGPPGANDGRVYVFAGDDLFLQADQSNYDNGDPIAIELRGGTPGVLGLIAVTSIDGAPLFAPLVLAPLDGNGELAYLDVTDPSYIGHTIELRGWCQRATGRGLVDSNLEWFKF